MTAVCGVAGPEPLPGAPAGPCGPAGPAGPVWFQEIGVSFCLQVGGAAGLCTTLPRSPLLFRQALNVVALSARATSAAPAERASTSTATAASSTTRAGPVGRKRDMGGS